MSNRIWTIGILVFVASLLVAWDIYVALDEAHIEPGEGGTISEVFLWAAEHPVFSWAFGVLCGHLLWPQRRRDENSDATGSRRLSPVDRE